MSHTSPSFNYTGHGTEGRLYEATKQLSTTEIAALVRKEIKRQFPKIKTSVRTEYFSGGSAIDVEIKTFPFPIFTENYIAYQKAVKQGYSWPFNIWFSENPTPTAEREIYSPEAQETEKAIKGILNQYNFHDCDGQIDYFHVNFYEHVKFDWELEKQEINSRINQ